MRKGSNYTIFHRLNSNYDRLINDCNDIIDRQRRKIRIKNDRYFATKKNAAEVLIDDASVIVKPTFHPAG